MLFHMVLIHLLGPHVPSDRLQRVRNEAVFDLRLMLDEESHDALLDGVLVVFLHKSHHSVLQPILDQDF